MQNYRQFVAVVMMFFLFLSSCRTNDTRKIEAEAAVAFEAWAVEESVPYKEVSYQVIEGDETFVTVRVTAMLRESAAAAWLEKQADIECRLVGEQWQCDSYFAFSPTETGSDFVMQEIAADKPVTASAMYAYNSGHAFRPYSIVDGQTVELHCDKATEDGNSYWLLPDHQTGWVQVDLQRPYKIAKLRWLNTHNGRCGDRATTKFHIALSKTGLFTGEETVIYDGIMPFTPSPQFEEFVLSAPIEAQYARFYVDEYHNWGGGLNEFEIYEEQGEQRR